jgi:S1-C subfamily serine protease
MRLLVWVTPALLYSATAGWSPVAAADESFSPEVIGRIASELSTRRLDPASQGVRGFGDVFRNAVSAVPLVISKNGVGSSVLVQTTGSKGYVITNHHVVAPPFLATDGTPYVIAIFHDRELARDILDIARVDACLSRRDQTPWCEALWRATRYCPLIRLDADRDLALVEVPNLPPGARQIPLGALGVLSNVSPGDEVGVIGHPSGFLWSLTTGIVSGVRSNYPILSSPSASRATVIQTQAPINPGNSGGPLLTASGQLLGVMFSAGLVPANTASGSPISVPAQGLNFAIAIDEVRAFLAKP